VRIELLITTLLVVFCVAAAVAVETASLDVTLPEGSFRVGDRLPVRVAARGGEDLLWGELRVQVEDSGPWAMVEGPREMTGTRPPVWELVLAPMETGELPLPAIAAGVRSGDAEAREIGLAGTPMVDVRSVLPEGEDAQPAPMREPLGVSGFPWEWVLPLMVPVLAVAAAIAWWGRRRQRQSAGLPVAVLAPYDELSALLDRLDGRVGREPAESICDRLAGGLRHYLERTSGEPAEEMTSFELRLLARAEDWPDSVQRGIQAVMNVADRVRFGRVPADEHELHRAIDSSREVAQCLEQHLAVVENEETEMEAVG
jgi:hypothetical protein